MPSPREVLQTFSAVVVTGGSSGIGKSFIQLTRTVSPDLPICNLSRRHPAIKISPNGARPVNHISCDLAVGAELDGAGRALQDWLAREVPRGRVLLINNSGIGTFGPFPKSDLDRELGMIDLNIRAVVHLTGLLLPELLRRGGAILNVASTVAFQPTPFAATYGASKAFVLHWTHALDVELRGSGVRALALCPGTTDTDFFRAANVGDEAARSGLTLSPDAVVAAAISALGSGRSQIVPGWGNKLYTAAASKLPKAFAARIAGVILGKRWRRQANS